MDKKCKCIHETVLRDIVDIVTDIKDSDELFQGFKSNKSFKSIASASSNLTLVFPVIVSRNTQIENASMVVKAIERKAVSMLQILFSALSISNSDDGMEFIKKFHTNLKIDDVPSVDQFIDAMDSLVKESAGAKFIDPKIVNKIKNDMQNINYFLPDSINECSLNDYSVVNTYSGKKAIKETQYHKQGINEERNSRLKDYTNYLDKQLLDNDVKKSNELVPTSMIVNFIYDDGTDANAIETQIVIGVKAKMYPVDSEDIINRLVLKNKDRNKLIDFVRSTTREISFVKDFLLAIDRCKMDALSLSNKGSSSKLWKILERRALRSKVRRAIGQVNDASAITTLVITQEEVEYIKKNENINLEKPNIIRPIMESLNFMGVCIIDESSEKAKFIFDTGDDIYETLSFRSLEREGENTNYKKIINLMTQMR